MSHNQKFSKSSAIFFIYDAKLRDIVAFKLPTLNMVGGCRIDVAYLIIFYIT